MDITDPKAMRALAHPLRIRLLELVAVHGPITAARCAEFVDQSPSNCSFHLRTLAEHGYIERTPGKTARDRPWQIVDVNQNWAREPEEPKARAATTALSDVFQEWEFSRIREGRHLPVPEAWQGHLMEAGATLFLTPDEASSFAEEYRRLIEPYIPRITDPAARPDESAPVRVYCSTTLARDLMPGEKES